MTKKLTALLMVLLFSVQANAFQPSSEKQVSSTAALWDSGTIKDKIDVITALIEMFKDGGTMIRKEPAFYVEEIERVRIDSAENYTKPIGEVFRALAVMYRDFDNGEDPDSLIRQVLGEEEYEFYVEYNESKMLEDAYNDWKASRTKLEE